MQKTKIKNADQKGTTLIEVLVAILILVMVIVSVFSLIRFSFKLIGRSEARITASNLANQRMELLRNLPYDKLGTTAGWPKGDIPSQQVKTLNNINYTVKTDIQYVDDPLDGLAPSDLYNADYKKVRVWVSWDKYSMPQPVILVSNFSPKSMEAPIGGGTLSFSVINTASQEVGEASVQIINTNLEPDININTQTDGYGKLLVPALPQNTGNNYEIKVTKTGFTKDYTSPISESMPNPLLPHQTILEGEVTSVTMTIDLASQLKIKTVDIFKTANWCDETYSLRKQLTVKNESAKDAPAELSVKYSLDHKTLVSLGKSQADGDDIRIFYFDGASCLELDREATTDWNAAESTSIWFKTKTSLSAGNSDNSYYLYYNNPSADTPPLDLTKIFNPENDSQTKGLYYFEDKTGTKLTDFSSHNNHGTLHENNWVEGKAGYGLEFKGGTPPSYVSIPVADNSSLDITGSLTLEAWIYPTNLSGKQSIIDRHYGYALWLDENYVNFGVFDAVAGMQSIKSQATLFPNTWTHLAGAYNHNSGAFKIFINGEENKTQDQKIDFFVTDNSYDLRLGNGYIAGDFASPFLGKEDEVRISNIARISFPYGKLINFSIVEGEETPPQGSHPLGYIPLKILGERILGFDADNKGILRNKFEDKITDANGNLNLSDIEWDNYTFSEESPSYDLAEISPPNAVALSPGTTKDVSLILVPHAQNTLHLTIKDSAKSPLFDVQAKLTKAGFEEIKTSSSVGQAFFTPLDSDNYILETTKTGYATVTETINISGNVEKEVILSASS